MSQWQLITIIFFLDKKRFGFPTLRSEDRIFLFANLASQRFTDWIEF